jgi:hypothetical protein
MIEDRVAEINSHYGYSWREMPGINYWLFNIHPGEIFVSDLRTKEILADKRGFIRTRPWDMCPKDKVDDFIYRFISKVVRPTVSEIK